MKPERWDNLLMAYLTGTLTEADHADFEQYLNECEPCREELREWRVIAQAAHREADTRAGTLPPLPATFYERLRVQPSANGSYDNRDEHTEDNMTIRVGHMDKEKRKRGQGRPVTLAAAVAAVVLGGLVLLSGRPSGPVQPLAGIMGQENTAIPSPDHNAPFLTATALVAGATGTQAVEDGIWTPDPFARGQNSIELVLPSPSATPVPRDLDPIMLTATQIVVGATETAAVEKGLATPLPLIITATPIPANAFGAAEPTVDTPVSSGMQPMVSAPARLAQETQVNGSIREKGIAVSDDGKYIAVLNGDHAVNVFAADTLDLTATFDFSDPAVTALAFGDSLLAIGIGTANGGVQFWSPDQPHPEILSGFGAVSDLVFSPDRSRLLIASNAANASVLWLYNIETQVQSSILIYDVPLAGMTFNADGTQIVVGTLDGRVLVLNVNPD